MSAAYTIVDQHGHALGCPAYNQPTFTLCTCGATERAGLPPRIELPNGMPPEERGLVY